MGFSKLHSSLVNSSLWTEPDHVRLLFITLLAMADRDGCVYGSKSGLERAANIDPKYSEEADPWRILMSPDEDSSDKMRAPENEGRRIEEVPGGFRLLNHAYYRGLRNDDDRAEQNRTAQARFRAKNKPRSASVSHRKPVKAQADADADAEKPRSTSASARVRAPEACTSCPEGGDEAGFNSTTGTTCSCARGRARAARYARGAAQDRAQKPTATRGGTKSMADLVAKMTKIEGV